MNIGKPPISDCYAIWQSFENRSTIFVSAFLYWMSSMLKCWPFFLVRNFTQILLRAKRYNLAKISNHLSNFRREIGKNLLLGFCHATYKGRFIIKKSGQLNSAHQPLIHWLKTWPMSEKGYFFYLMRICKFSDLGVDGCIDNLSCLLWPDSAYLAIPDWTPVLYNFL